MFVSRKYFGPIFAAVLSVSLLVYACGGGGGSTESGNNTATTGSKAASTSSVATQVALQVTSIGLNNGLAGKPSFDFKKSTLSGKAKAWRAILKTKANRKIHHALGTTSLTCDDGGDVTDTLAYSSGSKTFTTTTTANNCATAFGSIVTNGTLVVTEIDNSYTGTDPSTDPDFNSPQPNDLGDPAWNPTSTTIASTNGYTVSFKDANGNTTLMTKITGTQTMDVVLNGSGNWQSGTLTSNLTMEIQSDGGTANSTNDDSHEIFTLTNYTEDMTFDAWDSDGIPTHIVSTSNGTTTIDDQIDNSNDISVTFTNFNVDQTIAGNGLLATYTISLSGQLSSSCLGGAVTIATTTPIVAVGDACPTDGVITVTDSSNRVSTITSTSSGGVHIANPDGTTQDFASCEDVDAC